MPNVPAVTPASTTPWPDLARSSASRSTTASVWAGVGDTIELAIPATLAYGFKGRGPIPGGATLLFTIDLIAIAPPAP